MTNSTRFVNSFFAACSVAVLGAAFLMLGGCEKCDEQKPATSSTSGDPSAKPITKNNIVLPFFVEGANMEWWGNLQNNDNLYERRAHNQIFGPDGHPVTWSEFNRAAGTAKVNCTGQGTRVNIRIGGLIPNGVYSLFLMKFDSPGFDTAYTHLSGLGVAGVKDGSANNFTASASGDANVHVTTPGGPLSVYGAIGSCIPEDEYELHFVGIYHLDGQSHGPSPGPAGTYVENFAFIVLNH